MRKFKISNAENVQLLSYTFEEHPTTTKYCIEDAYTKNYLLGDITVDCSDICFKKNVIFDLDNNNCICNNNYKFEYNNFCYQKCPEGTYPTLNDKFICSNSVSGYYLDNKDHIYKKCYYKCNKCSQSGNDLIHNCDECLDNFQFFNKEILHNCYTVDEINDLQTNNQNYIDNVHKEFQKTLINEFSNISLKNGDDYIVPAGNIIYTVTNTQNQKNNINENVTTIDLGLCEDKLKQKYNISKNDSLYILKMDVLVEHIIKIEYEVYYNFSYNNYTKLDLDVCKDIKIDISIPKDIPFNKIDKYNKSSGFYNDICYTLTSESGTDKSLKDRKDEYKKNNLSVCEEDCDFTQYNNSAKKAICSCNIKANLPAITEIKLDKNKLFSNFKDIRNIGNFKMLKCIKLLFNKNNIFKNSANYMLIILFVLSIVSIIAFKFYDYKKIKKQMNIGVMKNDVESLMKLNILSTNIIFNGKNKKGKNTKSKKNIYNDKINSKKKNKNNHRKKSKTKFKLFSKKKIYESYNDYELNQLNYKDALMKDKRNFMQLYISLLRTNHILIFSFFQFKDYNSYMIKVYIFFFTFSMNYVVSAMFYSDSTMHQIYVEEGLFNFIYQLPQMFYSFIISTTLENILNFLGLYEKDIVEFRRKNKDINKKRSIKKTIFNIRFRIILFFIIDYILIFFFWVYLGCFCAVYKNTQIHLLLDVLSSLAISIITPFFLKILPCVCRILSLKDRKGKRHLLFKISNILDFF